MEKIRVASSYVGFINFKYFPFKVGVSDEYYLSLKEEYSFEIYDDKKKLIASFINEGKIRLKKSQIIYLKVNVKKKTFIHFDFYPLNVKNYLPYKPKFKKEKDNEILYHKIKGGTYLYCNVPESTPDTALDSILMQNKDLKGKCFLTFELQNKTSKDFIYYGYRLVNNSEKDAYIYVSNLGYQVAGSWLGEKSWMDYYGINFDFSNLKGISKDKYQWFNDYLNFDTNYVASPIKPTLIYLPKGKYIYLLGGVGIDNYCNYKAFNTANLGVGKNCCANANMLFNIKGKVTGELVCLKEKEIKKMPIQNFRKYHENDDMGGRIGKANQHGFIVSYPNLIIDENTKDKIEVKSHCFYVENLKEFYKRFEKLGEIKDHLITSTEWRTHLSSQLNEGYVGNDMVEHHTFYQGKRIIQSTFRSDFFGKIFDYGNWMIEYQDNITFINKTNKDKIVSPTISNPGSLFYIILDEKQNVLKAGATYENVTGVIPIIDLVLKANSSLKITLLYVLPANDCGSIIHSILVS